MQESSLVEVVQGGLSAYYEHLANRVERLAGMLSDDELWAKPFAFGNSVGRLVVHLTGNLNHYIGMKVITPSDIPELRFMPWLVGGLIGLGLAAAALGKRAMLYGWVVLFTLAAIAGLADFYRWGYDYGHNLAPDAIIKIIGMSYQPPLIGNKQLLNFSATSWPAAGGWVLIAGLITGTILAVREFRVARTAPA